MVFLMLGQPHTFKIWELNLKNKSAIQSHRTTATDDVRTVVCEGGLQEKGVRVCSYVCVCVYVCESKVRLSSQDVRKG